MSSVRPCPLSSHGQPFHCSPCQRGINKSRQTANEETEARGCTGMTGHPSIAWVDDSTANETAAFEFSPCWPKYVWPFRNQSAENLSSQSYLAHHGDNLISPFLSQGKPFLFTTKRELSNKRCNEYNPLVPSSLLINGKGDLR